MKSLLVVLIVLLAFIWVSYGASIGKFAVPQMGNLTPTIKNPVNNVINPRGIDRKVNKLNAIPGPKHETNTLTRGSAGSQIPEEDAYGASKTNEGSYKDIPVEIPKNLALKESGLDQLNKIGSLPNKMVAPFPADEALNSIEGESFDTPRRDALNSKTNLADNLAEVNTLPAGLPTQVISPVETSIGAAATPGQPPPLARGKHLMNKLGTHVSNALDTGGQLIGHAVDTVRNGIGTVVSNGISSVVGVGQGIARGIGNTAHHIGNGLGEGWKTVQVVAARGAEAFDQTMDNIGKGIERGIDFATEVAEDVVDGIGSGITSVGNRIGGAIDRGGKMLELFGDSASRAADIFFQSFDEGTRKIHGN